MTREKVLMIVETNPYMNKVLSTPLYNIFKKTLGIFVKRYYKHSVLPLILSNINNNKHDVTVVAVDYYAHQLLSKNGIDHKTQADYVFESMNSDAEEEAIDIVRNIPNLILHEDFKDAIHYNSTNLWFLSELGFWYMFKDVIKDIKIIKHIVETEMPDTIFVSHAGIVNDTVSASSEASISYFKDDRSYGILNKGVVTGARYALSLVTLVRHADIGRFRRASHVKTLEPKVILFGNEQRIGNMSISWLNELKKTTDVLALGIKNEWGGIYKDNSIPYKVFKDYESKTMRKVVNNKRKEFKNIWKNLIKDESFKDSWKYDGVNIWKSLELGLSYYFLDRFIDIVRYGEIVKGVIHIEKPDVIVTIDDRSPFGKTVNVVSRSLGVSTLIVQHGIVADHPIYGPICSDKYAVFGDAFKDALVKRGVNPDDIVVTGQPRFDALVNTKYDKKWIYETLNINKEKGLIVFASTDLPDDEKEMTVRELCTAMQQFPDKQLVIKPHPSDDGAMFVDLLCKFNSDAIVVHNHLYELLSACDLLITTWSTVGLEAIILDKPIVVINLMSRPDMTSYVERGAAIEVNVPNTLSGIIGQILYDDDTIQRVKEGRDQYVFDYAYRSDGKASGRVARLLIDMTINHTTKPKNYVYYMVDELKEKQ